MGRFKWKRALLVVAAVGLSAVLTLAYRDYKKKVKTKKRYEECPSV
jgi:hypothetical protein